MLDTADSAAIRAAAEGYCIALHNSDADFLADLCHERFFMTSVQPSGAQMFFDKTQFVDRCRGGRTIVDDLATGDRRPVGAPCACQPNCFTCIFGWDTGAGTCLGCAEGHLLWAGRAPGTSAEGDPECISEAACGEMGGNADLERNRGFGGQRPAEWCTVSTPTTTPVVSCLSHKISPAFASTCRPLAPDEYMHVK